LGQACQRLFDRIETALALLSVPPEVQCNIAKRFGSLPGDYSSNGLARLEVAVPKLDSAGQMAAAGQRSAVAPGGTRQLVFATEEADIAVSVQRRNGGSNLDVNGQVFPTNGGDESAFSAVLLQGMEETAVANADDLGEFCFAAIPPGDYFMLLSTDSKGVMVVPLQVSA
jgi:hypothetical protein